MSLGTILYNIIVMPIQIIYEIIFNCVYEGVTKNYGLIIVFLSILVNILVMPLYKRADAIQKEERDIEAKLKKGVDHIKKTFKSNEQTMMLQTYYRENNYKPTYVIKGLLPLLLQIPFFMAAYNFLSNYSALQGVSFGPIKDLGSPDQLLTIFGLTINVLPILMTLINFISSYIYTKGFPLKNKVQLYGMALIFLILLYNSPSGLTFYWTLNNLFSLIKNILIRLKYSRKIVDISLCGIGTITLIYGLVCKTGVIKIGVCAAGLILFVPMCKKKIEKKFVIKTNTESNNRRLVLLSLLFLSILVGLVIPSSVIISSPEEFVITDVINNPLAYVVNSFLISFGFFVLWVGMYYLLCKKESKGIFENFLFAICLMAIVNYMLFGKNLGMLSTSLQYEKLMLFTTKETIINIIVLALILVVSIFICKKKQIARSILVIGVLALCTISAINCIKINKSIEQTTANNNNVTPQIPLSKNGKNVIVIMLDRAMGEYIPYIFQELPELKEKYSGFTYYRNTVSFGPYTNISTPSLFGGYEYTPVELNKRDTEKLVDKHNEALKVMPVMFDNNGYKVSVADLPYVNYNSAFDLSIFDDYPNINQMYLRDGYFYDKDSKQIVANLNMMNFFRFGMMKICPIPIQRALYNDGNYNNVLRKRSNEFVAKNIHKASGFNSKTKRDDKILSSLMSLTKIYDEKDLNTFLMLQNDITHEPVILQKPGYEQKEEVDNTLIDGDCYDNYYYNGIKLNMNTVEQVAHYHVNVVALTKLGDWFDYLRNEGVYDNTRIILVSDHGRGLKQIDKYNLNEKDKDNESLFDLEYYMPLLMVKDFDSKEFKISDELMTLADVPILATSGIIENTINPFTNINIKNVVKKDNIYVFAGNKWNVRENNGNTFIQDGYWLKLHDDISNTDNWKIVSKDTLFPQDNN